MWVFVFAGIVKLWGLQALLKLYSLIVSPVEFQQKYELVVDKGEFNKLVTMNGHLSDLGLNSAEKVDEKLAELEKSKAEKLCFPLWGTTVPLVPPSEALRINYVYLIVKNKNIFFTQKTFGSLVARAIETSGALRNPERILSDEDIP